jgi:hypothetical protein
MDRRPARVQTRIPSASKRLGHSVRCRRTSSHIRRAVGWATALLFGNDSGLKPKPHTTQAIGLSTMHKKLAGMATAREGPMTADDDDL